MKRIGRSLMFLVRLAWTFLVAMGARAVIAGVPQEARQGANLFADSAYDAAADAFRQATIAAPDDPRWRYDLGLSEALSEDFENAVTNFKATGELAPPAVAGASWYNAGNVHYAMGDFAQAASAYRQALIRNPRDSDAKHNLELALRQLQEQQEGPKPDSSKKGDSPNEQQDEQNENQKQKKQPNQDDSDEQDPKEQDSSEQEQQNPEQDQNQLDDQANQDDQRSQNDSTLSRDQAERILRALADEEARLRDQARKMKAIPAPGGKDW